MPFYLGVGNKLSVVFIIELDFRTVGELERRTLQFLRMIYDSLSLSMIVMTELRFATWSPSMVQHSNMSPGEIRLSASKSPFSDL